MSEKNDHKMCLRCKDILPFHHFRYMDHLNRYDSYCKNCRVGVSAKWKQVNAQKYSKQYLKYFSSEKGFITAAIARKFKPSVTDKEQFFLSQSKHRSPGSRMKKFWAVEMTKQEMYAELILHIQLMKDKFPESDGRLCRICEKPWTYLRNEPGMKGARRFPTNFSIDRFNTLENYKKGNVIFCCNQCNRSKNSSEKWMWIKLLEIDKELNEPETD